MIVIFYTTLSLLLAYAFLIHKFRKGWDEIPVGKFADGSAGPSSRVTIVVPARNEEQSIGACLLALCAQSYPAALTEIIVVNDHSTDRTAEIVQTFGDSRIRLLNLEDFYRQDEVLAHKKKAIETAIAHATGDLILTTDADCEAPPHWVRTMEDCFRRNKAMLVAGPVRISNRSTLLSVFQILDFITMQGITGAAMHQRLFAMGNGANLGYTKKAFYAVDGFSGIDHIASGDDMLLIHKISYRFPGKSVFIKSADAVVNTLPAITWSGFLQQRIRWASKAEKYEDRKLFGTLLFVYVLNTLLLFWLVAACWDSSWLVFLLLFILLKSVTEYGFVRSVASFFGQQGLLKYFIFLQPLHIIYIFLTGLLGKFAGYRWKDRNQRS